MKKQKISFPEKGMPSEQLLSLMEQAKLHDARWKDARTWSLVFYPGEEIARLIEQAYNMFIFENGLNPTVFPSLRKMETEVLAMSAALLGGDEEVVGSMTSGGTESILMAVKTARDRARALFPHISQPEIILPASAHPAFEKAAHYLVLKPVYVPVGDDKRADPQAIQQAISPNTILIVASAPSYPHGVIDPIEEISEIARKHNILCHVDACVGGFMLPFIKDLGYPLPAFDFRLPGVTSMSADLHKYGYAAKGTSVVLYRDSNLRKFQYFVSTEWSGGIYGSPTMTGTRPGGAIAAAWSVIRFLGAEGYRSMAKKTMETTRRLIDGIRAIPNLQVIAEPDLTLLAFTSDKYDIFLIGDEMAQLGWSIDRQQFPNSLHLTVTQHHAEVVDEFLHDLEFATRKAGGMNLHRLSSSVAVSMAKGAEKMLPEKLFSKLAFYTGNLGNLKKSEKPARTAAMFGIASAIRNRADIYELVLQQMDALGKAD